MELPLLNAFFLHVNRDCISSFTEDAFEICVHADQGGFTLPEVLHTGGMDQHFYAS